MPDQILKVKVTTARLKVKARSHHDIAHLHHLTNVPTINFLPLTVSEIQAGQDFQTQGHYSKVKQRSHHDAGHLRPPPPPPPQCPY